MERDPNILVSVALICYNHGAFIERCLESIEMQETDFRVQVVIGDDASRDNTQEILKEYARNSKHEVRLLLAEKNKGVYENVMHIARRCSGRFVAVLEGDDWWTDPQKLQRQATFLDINDDYDSCFHDVEVLTDAASKGLGTQVLKSQFRRYSEWNHYTEDMQPWQLLEKTVIPTASFMYRNRDLQGDMAPFRDIDVSLGEVFQFMAAKRGKIRYFNEVWAAHNNHIQGITKKRPHIDFALAKIKTLTTLLYDSFLKKDRPLIYKSLMAECNNILTHAVSGKEAATRRKYRRKFLKYGLLYLWHQWRAYSKTNRS